MTSRKFNWTPHLLRTHEELHGLTNNNDESIDLRTAAAQHEQYNCCCFRGGIEITRSTWRKNSFSKLSQLRASPVTNIFANSADQLAETIILPRINSSHYFSSASFLLIMPVSLLCLYIFFCCTQSTNITPPSFTYGFFVFFSFFLVTQKQIGIIHNKILPLSPSIYTHIRNTRK